ncbi:Na/Pi-cotransporter family protein/PhoU family protein [Gottschalkia purinilytica]|uniref:Na/Pi-cotransporter family protein/PhoU family protein n=1 Tax=Gottschalkia purinilytica TaxID=1503 RepID=A0A0L0W7D1_GOTPU|nr:Na/Pi symporter [Gottschalkia purinilytica]KNF07453.1 Na/Pi-cotransporter family protein/PhoU family protein [Gottschalkia purinilytica]
MLKLTSNLYITLIVGIILGLALFLSGIKIMSNTFKNFISNNLKSKINKFTSSKFIGVIVGIVVTALLHSSSATTIIVVSLVHSNILNIYNAVPIIMGANIGTTFTSQLVAFKTSISPVIPLLILIPIFIILRKSRYRSIIKLLISLALIFLGLDIISNAVLPLKSSKAFFNLITILSNNKVLSIFAGILITAIIQSSTTGIAILQVMSASNIISVKTAIPIILGQNVGTCVDTVVGSLATNREGKQVAFIHVIFNLVGAIIFFFLIDFLYDIVVYLTPDNPSRQIANAHTLFNIFSTLILLPFSSLLVNISKKII